MKVPFFTKRKEKQAEERNKKRLEIEKIFQQGLKLTGNIEDPTKKIIELQKMSNNISGYIAGTVNEINAKGTKTAKNTMLGGVGGVGSAGLTGTILVGSGPIGWGIVGATLLGYAGAAVVGIKRGEKVQDKLLQESMDHISNLITIQDAINTKIDETMATNVDTISNSPLREKLLSMKGVSEKFTAAADKHLEELKNAPAAEEKAAPVNDDKKAEPASRLSDPRLLEENIFTKNYKKPQLGG